MVSPRVPDALVPGAAAGRRGPPPAPPGRWRRRLPAVRVPAGGLLGRAARRPTLEDQGGPTGFAAGRLASAHARRLLGPYHSIVSPESNDISFTHCAIRWEVHSRGQCRLGRTRDNQKTALPRREQLDNQPDIACRRERRGHFYLSYSRCHIKQYKGGGFAQYLCAARSSSKGSVMEEEHDTFSV